MTMLVEHKLKSKYTDAEVTKALHVLALHSGSARRAEEVLGIHEATLRQWRDRTHPEQYKRIRDEVVPQLYQNIAEECEAVVVEATDLELELIEHLRNQKDQLKPNETAGALRNVSVTKSINSQQAGLIRGRPSEIRMELGVEELVKAIGREFKPPSIDSTAQEINGSGKNGDTSRDTHGHEQRTHEPTPDSSPSEQEVTSQQD